MMHTIRLRGFWDISSDGTRTTHSRSFGRPRRLDAGERVWLVCTTVPASAEVSINGQVVGSVDKKGPFAADITESLQQRNSVEFTLSSEGDLGEVTLEMRPLTS